jgi:hypothetical protein
VRELRAISHSDRRSDQVNAEKLARFARLDPTILRPIAHCTVARQEALAQIRAGNLIVRLRAAGVNAVRGLAGSLRISASSFFYALLSRRCVAVLPPGVARALGPVLQQIADMTVKIKEYDGGFLLSRGDVLPGRRNLYPEPGDFRFHICKVFRQRKAEAFPRFQTARQYMDVMDSVLPHGHRHARTHKTVPGSAVEHQIYVTGDDDALLAPNFERIEAHRSWNNGHTLRILLEAQQIDDTNFLPRIQSRLQQLGANLQRSKQADHQHELREFQYEEDQKRNAEYQNHRRGNNGDALCHLIQLPREKKAAADVRARPKRGPSGIVHKESGSRGSHHPR